MKTSLDSLEEADDIIIGAGFSGLSAGLRLAQFGRKVAILEKHTLPGGLNSYYFRPGKKLYDSGLHVLTNREPVSRRWGLPMVYRQLGLEPAQLPLHPPTAHSLVKLGETSLDIPPHGADLLELVAQKYPGQADGWRKLWELMKTDQLDPEIAASPSRQVLERHLQDSELIDLLRLPVFLYGGYAAQDMAFMIFRNVFRSLFIEGVGHPGTIKHWLDNIVKAIKGHGGQIYYRAGISAIELEGGRAVAVRLESGQRIRAANIVSSMGWAETQTYLEPSSNIESAQQTGISAVETTYCLSPEEAAKACPHPMIFFHKGDRFKWDPAASPFSSYSISCAAHFDYPHKPEYCFFKIAAYLGGTGWLGLEPDDYNKKKTQAMERLEAELHRELSGVLTLPADASSETMTPRTVHRYTQHRDGSIYGGSEKLLSGETPYGNLFIVGNDQGGIGVVGALISGIVVANLKILTGKRAS